jgi:hypothetical protein
MKEHIIIILLIFSSISCTDGDKAIETVTENIERGAVLRTIDLENTTFDVNTLDNIFSVTLEEQDIEEGLLMETVDVYVQFQDNTTESQDISTSPVLLETIAASEWDFSGILPRNTLNYSFQELLEATGLAFDQVSSKDQFILDLSLNLNDGRSFDATNASSIIIAFDTFFSSPFSYTITLVQPVSDDFLTGLYAVESILDGPNGKTFVGEFRAPLPEGAIFEITKGTSLNTREFRAFHNLHHAGLESPRRWEFVVTDDITIMGKNQLSSPEGYCIFNAAPILIGPDNVNGPADSLDDTVFQLWFVEGYLEFDGQCDFTTAPSRYSFSKQ